MKPNDLPLPLLMRRIHRLMGRAIMTYHLIEHGDRILLGLSGGKDSLALLRLLGERMMHSGGYFSVEAIHVRMKSVPYASSTDYLQAECDRWQIPLHVVETDFEPDWKQGRTPCYLCARRRRSSIFEAAQRLGCRKIALAHHQDDVVKTALMNLTYNGSFSSMTARLDLDKMPLSIIRPFYYVPEEMLSRLAALCKFQPLLRQCPQEGTTTRTEIDRVVSAMQSLTPDYRESIMHALAGIGSGRK